MAKFKFIQSADRKHGLLRFLSHGDNGPVLHCEHKLTPVAARELAKQMFLYAESATDATETALRTAAGNDALDALREEDLSNGGDDDEDSI